MLAYLSIMAPEQKAQFERNQAIIHEGNDWSHIAMHDLSILLETCALFALSIGTIACELCDALISTNLFSTMLCFCDLFHSYVALFVEKGKILAIGLRTKCVGLLGLRPTQRDRGIKSIKNVSAAWPKQTESNTKHVWDVSGRWRLPRMWRWPLRQWWFQTWLEFIVLHLNIRWWYQSSSYAVNISCSRASIKVLAHIPCSYQGEK
jgi:hypothetical protein